MDKPVVWKIGKSIIKKVLSLFRNVCPLVILYRIRSDHNEDNTSKILQEWSKNVKHLYHRVLLNVSDTPGHYNDSSGPGEWSEDRYRNMMYLRQRALDSARKQWADYLFVGLQSLFLIAYIF